MRKLIAIWNTAEEVALALLTVGMVIFAATQIVLRNFFNSGLPWIDPMLGTAVLWITMFGALAATGARKHITVDIFAHFLHGRARAAVGAVTSLAAAFVCGLLAHAASRYVWLLRDFSETVFLRVPSWAANAVMPVVFGIMALRLLTQAVVLATEAIRGPAPKPEETPRP